MVLTSSLKERGGQRAPIACVTTWPGDALIGASILRQRHLAGIDACGLDLNLCGMRWEFEQRISHSYCCFTRP